MEWTDLKITVPRQWADTAEAIATGISGGGIYIEDYADLEEQVQAIAHVDLIEQDLLDKDREHVTVHMYLSPDENPAEVTDLLNSRLTAAEAPYTLELSGVEQEEWETAWKKYYHAMEIGSRLAVCPSWEEYTGSRKVIRLDPGMAFGTGTHETTSLCLAQLDRLVKGGERMLDIGTGSGILAIAALLLGAESAEGVDIDPMCVRTAGENAALYLQGARAGSRSVRLEGKNGVRYTVPQSIDPENMDETVTVRFRVAQPYRDAALAAYADGVLLRRIPKRILTPGEMEQFPLRKAELPAGCKTITFTVEEVAK